MGLLQAVSGVKSLYEKIALLYFYRKIRFNYTQFFLVLFGSLIYLTSNYVYLVLASSILLALNPVCSFAWAISLFSEIY